MNDRDELAYRAALMHYVQDETMESIASKLKISRSTVSRLIDLARVRGYIQFQAHPPAGESAQLRADVARTFGVNVTVVPIAPRIRGKGRLEAVAALAGNVIAGAIEPGITVGIAWGNTLSAVARHLVPKPVTGATVVQLNGAVNSRSSGILYAGTLLEAFGEAYRADVQHFPVPAFFDYAETKQALWRERAVKNVLELQQQADLAIFSVGTMAMENPSMVYAHGYISPDDLAEMRERGIVGDVCTVLIRADGTWEDLEMNARASGPTPTALSKIPRRICVVSGTDKAWPLLGALRAGVVTDLVVDEDCAAQLLKINAQRV
ncbi:MAG: sugar-binding domain-containing protein [Actinomycetaceae bacterium]|nr:transcriptional regulator [Arcanobacterium sp.]MDD7505224.1 sugar-binding domain-containing protein [Actinomycetaceae bacterium]MDY6143312.1 sugar-binding domain-containing protein [Arcanobacterium sp.]